MYLNDSRTLVTKTRILYTGSGSALLGKKANLAPAYGRPKTEALINQGQGIEELELCVGLGSF